MLTLQIDNTFYVSLICSVVVSKQIPPCLHKVSKSEFIQKKAKKIGSFPHTVKLAGENLITKNRHVQN